MLVDRDARSEIELEQLGLVPGDVRDFVLERDGQLCRVCGQYVQEPALHHVTFRSQGGLDVPGNLITIGWAPWHDCHLQFAHGPEARLWREIFQEVVVTPGVTAFQVRRWRDQKAPR